MARAHKGRQARAGEETYGESSCHRRVFQNKLLYSRLPHIMKYREVAVGELLVCKINLQKLLLKCSSQDKPAALTSYEYLGGGVMLVLQKNLRKL